MDSQKASFTVLMLLASASILIATNPGPKNGFRKLKWGDHPTRAMSQIGHLRGFDTYSVTTREGDDRRVAVDAFLIEYSFRRDRFCRVDVSYHINDVEQKAIIAILTREWGEPENISVRSGKPRNPTDDSREWLSSDGKTWALFSSPDSWQKDNEKHLWKLLIEERECAAAAAKDPGL